jgi:hypothetical protein
MVDTTDSIPANAISLSEAFECLFDAICPNAAELRTGLDRVAEINLSAQDHNHHVYDWAWFHREVAEREVDVCFREALSHNDLKAFQNGTKLSQQYWETHSVLPGMDEHPPIWLWKADFDAWLKKVLGQNKRRGRPLTKRNTVKQACIELWGGLPPKKVSTTEARNKVIEWHTHQRPFLRAPHDDTILRGIGRKK